MEFQDEAKVSSCHLNKDIRRQGGELPEPQPGNRNQGSGMRTNNRAAQQAGVWQQTLGLLTEAGGQLSSASQVLLQDTRPPFHSC